MKRKRQYKKKIQKRGRRISYFVTIEFILKKKTQKGTGAIPKVLGYLLQNVRDIIGL